MNNRNQESDAGKGAFTSNKKQEDCAWKGMDLGAKKALFICLAVSIVGVATVIAAFDAVTAKVAALMASIVASALPLIVVIIAIAILVIRVKSRQRRNSWR